ncbi:MAG: hypothetical protein LAO51_17340, partial [Acidobacteriia bacterium]|nr:hypothetical protein [Terriglobia bacterium]
MIKSIVVEVEPRPDRGKNASRRWRRAGRVPAVIYGANEPPLAVGVSPRRLEEVLHLEAGRNTIFTVAFAGKDQQGAVMIKDLQRDPVSELAQAHGKAPPALVHRARLSPARPIR